MNETAKPLKKERVVSGAVLTLRQLAREAVSLQNDLLRPIDPLALTAEDARIFIGLEPAREASGDAPWVCATIDGEEIAIQLPWGIIRRISGLPTEGATPEDAVLLIEAGLEPWLDQAEVMIGVSFRLVEITPTCPKLDFAVTLNVQGKDASNNNLQLKQLAVMSFAAAQRLREALEARRVLRPDLPGLTMPIYWEQEAVRVDIATFQSLKAGDAIELSQDSAENAEGARDGQITLANRYMASATRSGQSVKLTGPMVLISSQQDNYVMSQDIQAGPDEGQQTAASVEDVEIRLSFRAGHRDLTLRQLRELAPGMVIEMTDPASTEVEIVANGQVVGTGELIDVTGRKAIQIHRIFSGH